MSMLHLGHKSTVCLSWGPRAEEEEEEEEEEEDEEV